MTGIGGVFPNYEDHLLDKKKISECFDGNFHEVLYPLNYTSKYGPWQYHSPPDNNECPFVQPAERNLCQEDLSDPIQTSVKNIP